MIKGFKCWINKKIFENREMDEYDIDIEEMNKMLKDSAIVLDVRSPQEYNEGHINGAILLPLYEIKRNVDKILINKEQTIIVYCSTGIRSKKALKELKKRGYKKIYNLYNGLENY